MKILRLLNKKNLSIKITYFLLSFPVIAENKPIDIWNIEKKETETISDNNISSEILNTTSEISIYENQTNKKMICTNPDLIVDRGNKRELCAGSVAMVFEKMGGEVVYFGKPHPEVYYQSIDNDNKKILAIGDNLNTDIKGANLLNYDSLLISNGIHKEEIKDKGIQRVAKEYETIINFIQSDLKW